MPTFFLPPVLQHMRNILNLPLTRYSARILRSIYRFARTEDCCCDRYSLFDYNTSALERPFAKFNVHLFTGDLSKGLVCRQGQAGWANAAISIRRAEKLLCARQGATLTGTQACSSSWRTCSKISSASLSSTATSSLPTSFLDDRSSGLPTLLLAVKKDAAR